MDKRQIRKAVKDRLASMSEEIRAIQIKRIHENLLRQNIWSDARTIGLTIAMPLEIPTRPLIQKAWETSKAVAVPKCEPNEKKLTFFKLTTFDQLESVYFGLLEPIPAKTKRLSPSDLDLLIVPGLAYDARGFRVGFGGGFYDRFLTGYEGIKLALAFEDQIFDELPNESHDMPVDFIVTPSRVINCTAARGIT